MSNLSKTFTSPVIADLRAIKDHFGTSNSNKTLTCQVLLAARDFLREARLEKPFDQMSVQEIISIVDRA